MRNCKWNENSRAEYLYWMLFSMLVATVLIRKLAGESSEWKLIISCLWHCTSIHKLGLLPHDAKWNPDKRAFYKAFSLLRPILTLDSNLWCYQKWSKSSNSQSYSTLKSVHNSPLISYSEYYVSTFDFISYLSPNKGDVVGFTWL